MFRRIKIGAKITLLLLTVVMLSVFAIGYLSYNQNFQALEKSRGESFKVIVSLKAQQIESLFKKLTDNISFISTNQKVVEVVDQTNAMIASQLTDSLFKSIEKELDYDLVALQNVNNYANIYLTNLDGKVIYSSGKQGGILGKAVSTFNKIIENATDGIYFNSPRNYDRNDYDKGEEKSWEYILMYTAAPVLGKDGSAKGYVLILYDLSKNIYPILNEINGIGKSGEVILCEDLGRRIRLISQLKFSDSSPLSTSIFYGDNTSIAAQRAVKGEPTDYAYDVDYRGIKTLSSWAHIPSLGWGVIIKSDESELVAELDQLVNEFIKYGTIIFLFSFLISIFFSQFLIAPVLLLRKKLNLVAQGVLPENVKLNASDEIGEMAVAVADLVKALKRTANFANQIGKGNYNAEFQPLSKVDTLGNALLRMRDSIKEADINEKERNWVVSGVAELGQILRLYNSLQELGDHVTSFLTDKVEAVQGAFYVVNKPSDNHELTETRIDLVSTYAYSKKKFKKASFAFAEGLVGQTAVEKEPILRTEIPDNYLSITSGLIEEKKPTCLCLIPLVTDDEVYGVLEFASVKVFGKKEINFLEEISVIVARTIFNIKVNDRTVRLLKESQQMSQELKVQQEELRKNAEEMAITQKKLKRANFRLEDQVEEVNRTQKRMQLLLENASEIITILEKDGKIRYISPSIEPILGYTQFEMIGTKADSRVHPDSVETYNSFFEELSQQSGARATVQYEYLNSDGSTVWLEANGRNLFDDPAVKGLVINSRDITERRRAEQEERMRSQMQALSENSPDLIKRLNKESVFFYINPSIKSLTGMAPEELLGKSLADVPLNAGLKGKWKSIFQLVLQTKEKHQAEMEFPAIDGDRVMQVNAIPEFSDDAINEVESVLVVSHDITEQKKKEMEIRSSNRKVTESINYAKRIQSAILPDNSVIKDAFPESFIYYKPRDVVSGDFPWFVQQGDDLFIAAVDCTGHGVPGALISLIGYFILNDIVNSKKIKETGKILDYLNDGVTQTLRQDTSATTRDGMDLALVRVNKKEKFIEFAGAHRPLYYVRNDGEIDQIKGDRFPIGGGTYKTRTDFTTHHLAYQEGEEMYMFSDGLPDQFGGELNKKFGSKKIRKIISDLHGKPMNMVEDRIDKEFFDWMADKKQTDDILFIGIRL